MNPTTIDSVLEIFSATRSLLRELGRAPFERSIDPRVKLTRFRRTPAQELNEGAQAVAAYARQGRGMFNATTVDPSASGGAFNRALAQVTNLEQRASAVTAVLPKAIPTSIIFRVSLPALTTDSWVCALAHAHNHPPNLIPPNPVPLPMPSIGKPLGVPFIGCSSKVTISGKPAVRCGDLGLSALCGGFFPFFEVFLGSSKVWFEGQRAARTGVDLTSHCIFSTPKPTDPPLGPTIGIPSLSQMKVLIAGVPMPSVTAMVMGLTLRAAFTLVGHGVRQLARIECVATLSRRVAAPMKRALTRRAEALVDRALASGKLAISASDEAFSTAVRRDLTELAMTRSGRRLLRDLETAEHTTTIVPLSGRADSRGGPASRALTDSGRMRQVAADTPGAVRLRRALGPIYDHTNDASVVHCLPGTGSGSTVAYDPLRHTKYHFSTANTPNHVALGHELQHSVNTSRGVEAINYGAAPTEWISHNQRFHSIDELSAIRTENSIRDELGLPLRHEYGDLP